MRLIPNSSKTSGALVVAGMALLLCAAKAGAQKVYRDPGGAYSVNIPNGWQTEAQPGSPMVSLVDTKTKVSVTLGVMKGPAASTPSAENELKHLEGQFPQS